MAVTSESPTPVRTVSWGAATWTVPFVPPLWLALFVLTAEDVAVDGERGQQVYGLVVAAAIAVVGGLVRLLPDPQLRGIGTGIVAGAVACGLPWLLVVLR